MTASIIKITRLIFLFKSNFKNTPVTWSDLEILSLIGFHPAGTLSALEMKIIFANQDQWKK